MQADDYQRRRDRLKSLDLMSYREYLESEVWQTRRFVHELDHHKRCAFCGSEDRMDLHHRSYDRLSRETDNDLLWLCRSHHQEYHDTGEMPARPTEQQVECLEDIGCTRATIRSLSHREAARRINGAQQKYLRSQRDCDNDWFCTDENTKRWIERNCN